MANPEHLRILRLGVSSWNKRRQDNAKVFFDWETLELCKADLSEIDLSGADFSKADLGGANLSRTNLRETNFYRASLVYADLSKVDLSEADLREADLNGVDLSGAILRSAIFTGADLSGADLSNANFIKADLSWAKAIKGDLSGAKLIKADLSRANLSEADLSGADLSEADLSEAMCTKANLSIANLRAARLINTQLYGATLSGACLWETQRAGWMINRVICEYVYWDKAGEEGSVYNPREFERLFADKTKVRLFYKDGINPLEIATLPALIKYLEESHPRSELRLVSIQEGSGGVVVELAIEDAGDLSPEQLKQLKVALETEAQQKVEYQRQALIERENYLLLKGKYEELKSVSDKLIARGSIIMGDTYNISGQAGAVGQNANASNMTFNQIVNNFEKSIDLPELAKQLGELREEIAKRQDSSPQVAIAQDEAAKAEIAAKEGNTSKVVEHLKTGGQWLMDIAKETGKEVLAAAIKASMGMQ